MSYQTIFKPEFRTAFAGLDRSIQPRVNKAIDQIERAPTNVNSKNIEKLKHWQRMWTCRVNRSIRILYAVHGEDFVQLITVGTHDHLEKVLTNGADVEEIGGAEVIEDVLDPRSRTKPSDVPNYDRARQQGRQRAAVQRQEQQQVEGKLLPMAITEAIVQQLGIPEIYQATLIDCYTEENLLNAGLPQDIFDRVFNWLYDDHTLLDAAEQPDYVLQKADDLQRYTDGDLMGFLLLLDEDQESLVDFALNKGPTLIKGGPGSGKSTIALYRVKSVVEHDYLRGLEPRVLFTTYTNALVNASRQLLEQLLGVDFPEMLEVSTLDNIAREIVAVVEGEDFEFARRNDWKAALRSARVAFQSGLEQRLLNERDRFGLGDNYLIDEMQWVIEGRGLATLDEYLAVQRYGRSYPFNPDIRRAVWRIYEHAREYFALNNTLTWNGLRRRAIDYVQSGQVDRRYDYIFVDEAQDLTPMGLKLCVALCQKPSGLFLTADGSQSLYNKGFSWSAVHDDLDVRGRTRLLKRNYRTTRQIAEAAHHFLHGTNAGDTETLAQQYIHAGAKPFVFGGEDVAAQFEWLYEQLHTALRDLRQGWGSVAVLVPNNNLTERVRGLLAEYGVPVQVMKGHTLDLDAPVVKVMTMHSAKGLEFPIVVLPFVEKDQIPRWLDHKAKNYEEELNAQRRLFYVAATRAMRYLFVTYTRADVSPFVADLAAEHWTIV